MRKRRAVKRDVLPDPVYNSKTISKLINNIMLDGKKGVAQNILYDAFKKVEEKIAELELKIEEMEATFTTENPSEETLEIYNTKKADLDLALQEWEFLGTQLED